jgi:hypothetical protein
MHLLRRLEVSVSRPLASLLMLFIALAVAPAAPRLKVQLVTFYPTRVGTCWVYDCDGEDEKRIITAVREIDGAKLLTVEWKGPKHDKPRVETLKVSAEGVHWMGFKDEPFDPLAFMLKHPLTDGKTWDWKLTGLTIVEQKGTATVHGPETIDVPAGKFTVYRIEYLGEGREDCEPSLDRIWFADIGAVKMEGWHGPTWMLKSFTPGTRD